MRKLRLCFAGTPAFAAAHLSALLNSQHEIAAVYTQPDRRSGRGKKLLPSPVKNMALDHHLSLFQPGTLKAAEEEQQLKDLAVDLLIVVAYGLILPKAILDIPKFGCINVHASLLPRWRGAAPIERSILAGDKETGVTIMQMDEGLDTGAMLQKETIEIGSLDTRLEVEAKLTAAGITALIRTLGELEHFQQLATEQDNSLATYANKIAKSEALIDWNKTAEEIGRQVRASIGRNPAYSFFDKGRIRLLQATPKKASLRDKSVIPGTIVESEKSIFTVACKDSLLQVSRVQLPGKNPMNINDVSNSRPDLFSIGRAFSSLEPIPQ